MTPSLSVGLEVMLGIVEVGMKRNEGVSASPKIMGDHHRATNIKIYDSYRYLYIFGTKLVGL